MDDSKQKDETTQRVFEFISKVILPYTIDLGETLKRILEKHRIRTIFNPTIKPSTILSSEKDIVHEEV